MIYAFFDPVYVSLVLNKDGSPEIVNGQYTLVNHGAVIMILSKEKFIEYQVYEARENSGHWMAVCLFAYWAIRRKTQTSQTQPRPDLVRTLTLGAIAQ